MSSSITRSRPLQMASGVPGEAQQQHPRYSPNNHHDTSNGRPFGSSPSFFTGAESTGNGNGSPASSSIAASRPRRAAAVTASASVAPGSSSSPKTASSLAASRPMRKTSSSASSTPTLSASATSPIATGTLSSGRPRAKSKNRLGSVGAGSYERESKFDRLFGSSSNGHASSLGVGAGVGSPGESPGSKSAMASAMGRGRSSSMPRRASASAKAAAAVAASKAAASKATDEEIAALEASVETATEDGSAVDGKPKKGILRCERCNKVYHHPQSLIKHRWQHTELWDDASSYGLSKHQTVQALEAAVILANPDTLRLLPDDKSHWPAAVSPPTSGLLGSDRLNIDVLNTQRTQGFNGFSRSMPAGLMRGNSKLGISLGSMAEHHEEEEEEHADETSGDLGDDDDKDAESTESEEEGGIMMSSPRARTGTANGNGNGHGRSYGASKSDRRQALREDTEMAEMDEEMFSLDLASQAGTPAGQHAALPSVHRPLPPPTSAVYGQSGLYGQPARSRLAYAYGRTSFHNSSSGTLASIPSQGTIVPQAFRDGSGAMRRAEREQSTVSSSTDISSSDDTGPSASSSSNARSTGTGETSHDPHVPSHAYQQAQGTRNGTLKPNAAHLAPHHPNGFPNLSVSAPVLGFFTESHPPSAAVVSPHLGPTQMTSPQLHATASPHLAPVPAGALGIGQSALEQNAAEVLSSSHSSASHAHGGHFASPSLARADRGHGEAAASAQPSHSTSYTRGASLSSGHGFHAAPKYSRRLSSARGASGASYSTASGGVGAGSAQPQQFSGSPYARSPYLHNNSALHHRDAANASPGPASGFSTSFGQAPLGSSFRSTSVGVGAYASSPVVRPVDKSSPPSDPDADNQQSSGRYAEQEEEIMDMDL